MAAEDFRHVCFKDLENYFKKDEYFSGLTENEKELIRKNLGILTSDGNTSGECPSQSNNCVIKGSYKNIKELADMGMLHIGNVYIIDDFQSIYKCDEEVLGTDKSKYPSPLYYILLTPVSSSEFSKRASILPKNPKLEPYVTSWIIEYDITEEYLNGVSTKGKITYLKDQNNNSAYYDFKTIRFKRTKEELNKGPVSYTEDQYMFTFNYNDAEASNGSNCKNNVLEPGSYDNVFLGGSYQNNTFKGDCHNNTFFRGAENNYFDFGTYNNYFTEPARRIKGAVHDKTISEIISMSAPKEFNVLNDRQVIVYLDPVTQTYQIKNL